MGRRGPKPLGRRARTLRLPPDHHELYEVRARQAGMDWNGYVAWALARFHDLEPPADPATGDQLVLAEPARPSAQRLDELDNRRNVEMEGVA